MNVADKTLVDTFAAQNLSDVINRGKTHVQKIDYLAAILEVTCNNFVAVAGKAKINLSAQVNILSYGDDRSVPNIRVEISKNRDEKPWIFDVKADGFHLDTFSKHGRVPADIQVDGWTAGNYYDDPHHNVGSPEAMVTKLNQFLVTKVLSPQELKRLEAVSASVRQERALQL